MKFFLLLLACNIWMAKGWSQSAQNPLTVNSELHTIDLNKHLWFFEDTKSRYTSDNLLEQSFQEKFTVSKRLSPNFGFTKSSWWAMIPIQNTSGKTLSVVVAEAHTMVDAIDFWLVNPKDRTIQHVRMGDRIPADINRQYNRQPSFPADLPPGDSLLFIRIKTEGACIFNISLYSLDSFNKSQLAEYAFLCTGFGILLVMGLYNFFIWLQLRKASYLVYCGFIVAMVGQSVSYSGLGVHLMDDYTWYMNEGYVAIADLAAMFAFIFPVVFLSLRKRHPWLTRICFFGVLMSIASSLCLLYSYELAGKLAILTSTLASFVTLSCGIVCSLKRYRPAYFFTIAWLVLIITNLFHMAALSGHVPASFWAEWSVMVGSIVEVVFLSLALADKVRLTEVAAYQRIETLNLDLEKMVDEQTREIKSILQHIQIGIVVVSKQGMVITENYSDSAKAIFQTDKIAGRHAIDLILGSTSIEAEHRSQIHSILECSLGESSVNFDFNAHILPRECMLTLGEASKVIQLEWNPVIDENGLIEKIIVSIIDMTEYRKLELEAEEKSKELSYIGEILEVAPKQFAMFMSAAQQFMSENFRLLKGNRKYSQEVVKILFINLHTIKGSARALGLKHLTPSIHEFEQHLAAIMQNSSIWNHDKVSLEMHGLQSLLDVYHVLNHRKLGRTSDDSYQLNADVIEKIQSFVHLVMENPNPSYRALGRSIRDTLEDLTFVRAETVFREILSHADMLARDLKKECPRIEIRDHGISLGLESQNLLRNLFTHIIRNSMDHGIESSEERLRQGKAAEGKIQVEVLAGVDGLEVVYRDDGRGLNMLALDRKGRERGLIDASAAASPEDIAELIFEPGFSTSGSVDEISGRGMGMNAVRSYIEASGGRILLELDHSSGPVTAEFMTFQLRIILERKAYIQRVA